MSAISSFSFLPGELPEKLKLAHDASLTGYWQIQLRKVHQAGAPQNWLIAICQGRIIFTGNEGISAAALVATLQRYLTRLRTPEAKEYLSQFSRNVEQLPLGKLLLQMQGENLISHDEAIQALRFKVLSELDEYLFDTTGHAEFHPDYRLVMETPIHGFDLPGLLLDAASRQIEWQQLRSYFPSLRTKLSLSSENLAVSDLPELQKQQLRRLLAQPRTLAHVAADLGVDDLSMAKGLSRLVQKALITTEMEAAVAQAAEMEEVFIVDDSPVLLKQFRALVESWGYQVQVCSQALTAVDTMLQRPPAIAFLDINMPGISGFELIKQIRRQPELAEVPLVLLTAEKSVSNQWRAQWANCKFLAKPRTPNEIPNFRLELQALLQELSPNAQLAVASEVFV